MLFCPKSINDDKVKILRVALSEFNNRWVLRSALAEQFPIHGQRYFFRSVAHLQRNGTNAIPQQPILIMDLFIYQYATTDYIFFAFGYTND